jgi:hypothetical protein
MASDNGSDPMRSSEEKEPKPISEKGPSTPISEDSQPTPPSEGAPGALPAKLPESDVHFAFGPGDWYWIRCGSQWRM